MSERRVLIVEDENIIALALKIQLESMGHNDIEIVTSGEEAVTRALADKFDLILMDIKLKGEVDGIEAAQIIKKKCKIALVYMSGNSDLLETDRLKETKPDGIMKKPIAEYELLDVLNKLFQM